MYVSEHRLIVTGTRDLQGRYEERMGSYSETAAGQSGYQGYGELR